MKEDAIWIVCSNDNNNGCGSWDYQQPEEVTQEVYGNILNDRAGNSLADVADFKTEAEAQSYYNRMSN